MRWGIAGRGRGCLFFTWGDFGGIGGHDDVCPGKRGRKPCGTMQMSTTYNPNAVVCGKRRKGMGRKGYGHLGRAQRLYQRPQRPPPIGKGRKGPWRKRYCPFRRTQRLYQRFGGITPTVLRWLYGGGEGGDRGIRVDERGFGRE